MIAAIGLTDDVELRVARDGDGAALAAAYVKNREHLAPWDPIRPPEFYQGSWHESDLRRLLDLYNSDAAVPMVFVRGDEIVGRLNVTNIIRGPYQNATLGYWLDASLNGQGIVSRAVEAVVAIARDQLGLHRLEASTLVHNLASQRVLAKAGFVQVGLAPKYLRIAGEWQDHRLFQRILHD